MVNETEVIQTKKWDKVKVFKLILGLAIFVIWCILIGIKVSNKDFSLKWWFIGAGVLTGLFLISFPAKIIADKMKKGDTADKIPEPLDQDKVLKFVYTTIEGTREKDYKDGYFRNVKKIGRISPQHINKNLIYLYEVFLSGEIELEGKKTDRVLVIVNATYPNIKPSIRLPELSEYREEKQVNKISQNPEQEPDIEKSKEGLDAFGKPVRETEKITHPKDEKEQKKEDNVV